MDAGENGTAPRHGSVVGLSGGERAYRDFTTAAQVLILAGSLLGNATMLWCACCTNVFKSVTSRFIKNLACSGICASLVCVPFDVALNASPRCCWWVHTLLFCKAIKLLQKLFCSVTVLSFAAIALDRYYSVLYPLERKISDAKSRDVVIYIWIHAVVASVPVLAVTNVTDVYATSSCSDSLSYSLGHLVYVVTYNVTTVILPLVAVFVAMAMIRRALSASQKKKVIIAALRTPQNSISIPYVSQREAELHATLLSVVLAFATCSAPYVTLVVYRSIPGSAGVSALLRLTAVWLPKVSLLTNPLLFLTVNRSVRRCLLDVLARFHRRYSRRNAISSAGLGEVGALGGEVAVRSGSQLLEMFNIGQQQIFRPNEEEEDDENNVPTSIGSSFKLKGKEVGVAELKFQHPAQGSQEKASSLPKPSPIHACAFSSSQVAPATPSDPDDTPQFGFGPFELPPQWLPETRNSKKRLLPPLGNTPEELIQTKQTRVRPERRISRSNKISTFPTVDP
ncbi:G-protein coupled receptor 176 [Denticeps clupeoides]|uniref:G-protein coupled receptors family 1 profile domain-containing protein n=1 Tax=Denticeps clupeoides TaxID=299321 RepID=A0AAY4BUI9_9TELE|nr:G-protein coupled receptor 176 [Denticeps clupeoides]XP_028809021.1 G-protein coupled receptor 176 [Denticeps clupeoides]